MSRARTLDWLSLVFLTAWPLTVQADKYDCYTRLGDPTCQEPLDESVICRLGPDFEIHITERDSQATVLAIHAGRIELDTGRVAAALAARLGWDFYEFQGHGERSCLDGLNNPAVLHITSTSFNEPTLLSMLANDRHTISIHGYAESASEDPGVEIICAGGKDDRLIAALADAVAKRAHMFPDLRLVVDGGPDFSCLLCSRLAGADENNIVNRNSRGAGLQLELSRRLRQALVDSSPTGDALRDLFYGSLQEALAKVDENDRLTFVQRTGDTRRLDMTQWRSRLREAFSRLVTRLKERTEVR